jgi:hypothetical protein
VIEDIPLDLVTGFPFEYMHLVCIGVTKKLVKLWLNGERSVFRLSNRESALISSRLISYKKFIPLEVVRRPRGLSALDRWKATELRQFLLYTGLPSIHGLVESSHFNLFRILSVSIRILCSSSHYIHYSNYSDSLLRYFVNQFKVLYGEKQVSYNVHSLIYLAADSKALGTLDEFSALKFENHVEILKRLLRIPHQPLQQIHRRMPELQTEGISSNSNSRQMNTTVLLIPHSRGPLLENTTNPQYSTLQYSQFKFRAGT